MSAEVKSSDNENLCVLCFKNVDIYSFGVCDHPVCFECSTRMRVLCKQNECPMCRQDMPKVIFTKKVEPFASIFPQYESSNLQDRRIGVHFCTSDIQRAYYKLLEHRCSICSNQLEKADRTWPFKSFTQLKDHMRREHELFYCEICADNLKIFSNERKTYTRQLLGLHRRKGDPDNTSHRGHPLCEFCEQRFMDNDEMFRHLRRFHLFCHFCDADGRHLYYNQMEDLKKHFRTEHFFCEEGECLESPLTAVFRTDIDLKGHITREHSRHMTKTAGKLARTLDIEFTLAPRPRLENRNKYTNRRDRMEEEETFEPGGPPGGNGGGGGSNAGDGVFINSLSSENFPTLGNSSGVVLQRPLTTVNFTSKFNRLSGAEFPTLGAPSGRSSPALTITTNSASRNNRAPEVTITRTVRNQRPTTNTKDHFPALGASSASGSTVRLSVNQSQNYNSPKVSIQVTNNKMNGAITTHITTSTPSTSSGAQQKPAEAFPALGKSTPVYQPQWVQQKSKKHEPKQNKVAPAPQLPPSGLSDFPTLSSAQKKKTSSVTMPMNNGGSSNSGNSDSKLKHEKVKTVETKMQNMKVVDNSESNKSKSKKKKKGSGDGEKNTESTSKNNNMSANNVTSVSSSSSNKNVTKKRSELKIGTLSNAGETSQISTNTSCKAPPGFNVKPPPGFSNGDFPSLGSNDLTFTNSTGQSYSITPATPYRNPPNFNSRNQNLIKRFITVRNNNDVINEFKTYSVLFRQNDITASRYYDHCKSFLGDSFDDIFPELLVLLPDIGKQQELYTVYAGKSKKQLVVCENCKQVLFKNELVDHYSYHSLENHFPTLGKAQQVNNVWKK